MQQTASPIDSYCSRLGSLSARTARSGLSHCLQMLGMQEGDLSRGITYGDSSRLVRALHDRYRPRTASKMISFWRELIRECWRMGYMDKDAAERAMPRNPSRPHEPPAGRHLDGAEVQALISVCGKGMTGSRNEVLVCLLSMGLRRGEIIGLNCSDWQGGMLRVRGKGGRVRDLRLPSESAEAIDLWLVRRHGIDGFHPLLTAVKGDESSGERLSRSGIRAILNSLVRRAGVKRMTPHDFRRTFAGEVLGSGADIGIVMRLMGHSNPSTTLRYDRRPAEAAWEWTERLGSPLRGKETESPRASSNAVS